MIDHLLGRPSPSWKRNQVLLVIFFWLWRILKGDPGAPRFFQLRRANSILKRFTPWQLIISTLTGVYAIRNLDKVLGLGSPEPLARLYSPAYYRATWIVTGLDAGFATAMSIPFKWLRDICSILFSIYYIIYANEADEKIRRFRAVPTVEMLRTTWEKTTNPYIRLVTRLPPVTIRRKILLPRPKASAYQRPITAYLFFALPEKQLSRATDLVLDFPGGGFVSMTPEHHEERLRMWARKTCRPVLSIDYGKAPEYPYPFAIDEAFDTYKVLAESSGQLIGMSGKKLNIIMSGDSAGANLVVNIVFKILELRSPSHPSYPSPALPMPLSLVLNYPALDFNFTSWMTPSNLRVLQSEHSTSHIQGLKELAANKDHLAHVSPLSMVSDKKTSTHDRMHIKRKKSWRDTIIGLAGSGEKDVEAHRKVPTPRNRHSANVFKAPSTVRSYFHSRPVRSTEDQGALADAESDSEEDFRQWREEDRPIGARVRYVYPDPTMKSPAVEIPRSESALERQQQELSAAVVEANTKATLASGNGNGNRKGKTKEPLGTRLTMTSRTGYFQDRIVSPSMMRAMAILYIGPHRNPDFATDYWISPILAPSHLLAQFPPLLMQCGEKDPFVDDTVIFAGRVREAKRARRAELDLALSGKSARFGEGLRMSSAESSSSGQSQAAMKRERDQLANEGEDGWVQMVLFSDWSHGYLQMPTLMSEAKAAIEELGEWIEEAFGRYSNGQETPEVAGAKKTAAKEAGPSRQVSQGSRMAFHSPFETSETETDDSAITFVPKRFRSSSASMEKDRKDIQSLTPFSAPVDSGKRNDSSGSDGTLQEDAEAVLTPPDSQLLPPPNLTDVLQSALGDSGYSPRVASPRISGGGKTGQTITEEELMKRRRMLDAHIFD